MIARPDPSTLTKPKLLAELRRQYDAVSNDRPFHTGYVLALLLQAAILEQLK